MKWPTHTIISIPASATLLTRQASVPINNTLLQLINLPLHRIGILRNLNTKQEPRTPSIPILSDPVRPEHLKENLSYSTADARDWICGKPQCQDEEHAFLRRVEVGGVLEERWGAVGFG